MRLSDDEVCEGGCERGSQVGERRSIGGAVGEAVVHEPPKVGRTPGRRHESRRQRTQLTFADHLVVGQAAQRQVTQREHLPDVDAEREDVRRRGEGTVEGIDGREVDVHRGGGQQLGGRPADRHEALPQRHILGGVDIATERRTGELHVQRRRQQDVTRRHVAVNQSQISTEVMQTRSDLTAQRQLL